MEERQRLYRPLVVDGGHRLAAKPALLRPEDEAVVDTANVEFAWSDVGAATYQLRVDGMVYTSAATSTTQALADGIHSWRCKHRTKMVRSAATPHHAR